MTIRNKRANTKPPVIDFGEHDDQHFKSYLSKSMKAAIKKFATREGYTESEAGRVLFLIALEDPRVFGGYEAINSRKSLLNGNGS